jgi:hypothetical protein
MKKLLVFTLFFFALQAKAATSVTTSSVSGHWTMSGSPYLVYNNISINAGSSLTIDPGVDVIFQGAYKFEVSGTLIASGTASLPINFTVSDTTGWSTDTTTAAGGWHGLRLYGYAGGLPDSTVLNFCNLSYTKFCLADATADYYSATLYASRYVTISNCNIFQNKTNRNCVMSLINISGAALGSGQFELAGCSIHDNFAASACMELYDGPGCTSYIHNNTVYHNHGMGGIIRCILVNMLFESNELYENLTNTTGSGNVTVSIDGLHATVRKNKFHHNTNFTNGALLCTSGFIDIDNNIICNNQHTSGLCGYIDGGGGLNLIWNSGVPADSTLYNVRNNIIANNYSPFRGGGINLLNVRANIFNNQIINNSSPGGSAIHLTDVDTNAISIKNNIITGNTSTAGSESIYAYGNSTLSFGHNYIDNSFCQFVYAPTVVLSVPSDTLTNIIGTTAGMVAPTLTSSVTDNALLADFRLLATSPCINHGDNSVIISGATDLLGNPRVMGGTVDLGSYEYIFPLHTPVVDEREISVYPNPATNYICVSTPQAKGILCLRDITGRVVAQQQVAGTHTYFETQPLQKGVYTISWKNGADTKSVQEVVIE